MPTIPAMLGRVLDGRYRLEAGLGTGASAHVFLAYDRELARHVAVKLLHPGLANDAQFLPKFRAEARALAAALNHPNIVQIYDWGYDDGDSFLVLEYLAGGSLRDLFDRGVPLGLPEIAQIGAETARGLAYAHSRGLVHRDVKPANLLFSENGVVHVGDFGLARALVDAAWTEPLGIIFGTARYASPEQASGMNLDERSDVYSLALVCYEGLVGEPAFIADTPTATLMARVGATLPPSPLLGPLAPILTAATTTDPARRMDAASFAAALEEVAATLPPAHIPIEAHDTFPEETNDAPRTVPVRRLDDTEMIQVANLQDEEVAPNEGRARSLDRTRGRLRRRFALLAVVALLIAGGATAFVRYGLDAYAVPRVIGMTEVRADHVALAAGLRMGKVTHAYSASVPSGEIVSQSLRSGASVHGGTALSVVVSLGHAPIAIPRLVGLATAIARDALVRDRFAVRSHTVYSETVAPGVVIASSPQSGLAAPYGSAVSLEVSRGPHPRTIPNLLGLTYAAGRNDLISLRLVSKRKRAYSNDVPTGEIIATEPAVGTGGIAVGTPVTLVVSRGPQLVAIPNVAGLSIADAVSALQAAGLSVTEQIGPPFATTATTTDPPPGSLVAVGSSLTLYVA